MNVKQSLIWLVDDDPICVYTMTKLIRIAGFVGRINTYHNGQEALQQLYGLLEAASGVPDIIFLDINMPGKNGWEFLDEYQAFSSSFTTNTSLYIMTSSADDEDVERSKQYPVIKNYFVKPVFKEAIEDIIRSH